MSDTDTRINVIVSTDISSVKPGMESLRQDIDSASDGVVRAADSMRQATTAAGALGSSVKTAGADAAQVNPQLDAVNAQLRAMAERSKNVTGEITPMFTKVAKESVDARREFQALNQAVNANGKAVSENSGFFASHSYAIRNAAYQVGDFAVQVQNGTRVTTALSQQLPQLLVGFGTFGAVAGVVAAVLPSMVSMMARSRDEAKSLSSATSDLSQAIGDVGDTARQFSMDRVYQEFNSANAVVRQSIIEQVRFQQTLIETRSLIAQQSLSKSLDGLGEFTFLDKLQGAFGSTGAEKLAKEMGVSLSVAQDLLPAISGLRDGSEDASNFIARFGSELAKSKNANTQKLINDIREVAAGSRDAAAAQSKLSEAIEKMTRAGSEGMVALDKKTRTKTSRTEDWYGDQMDIIRRQLDQEMAEMDRIRRARDVMAQSVEGLTRSYGQRNAVASEALMGENERRLAEALRQVSERATQAREALAQKAASMEDNAAVQAEYKRGLDQVNAAEEAQIAIERANHSARLAMQQDWTVGATNALRTYRDRSLNVADATEQAFGRAFASMEDDLVNFAMTGKANFSDFAKSVIADLMRIQIRAAMGGGGSSGGGIFGMIGSFVGSLFGGGGGMDSSFLNLGNMSNASSMPSYAAMSFAGGGDTGPGARVGGLDGKGGYWAIMHPQETVIDRTLGQQPQVAPRVEVVVNNLGTPQTYQQTESRMSDGRTQITLTAADVYQRGELAQALEATYPMLQRIGT